MTTNASTKCPQCGAALSAGAPAGLCPRCLMALNLKAETVFTGDQPSAQSPLPPERIAPHFPQLEILECLGRGGMGVVYKARQRSLDRLVALKILAPERVHDASFAERFTREARALAALSHPNIVTIHDFGQAGGYYFLLMEFVDGANLRQLLRARKFTPEEALAIVPPLCEALQFAHDRGVVHCDIKPENLLLDKSGRVKIADFGVARMLGVVPGGPAAPASEAATGAAGTPGYSAPEQLGDPRRVDSRADIYSLGAVFYEMLTGELPGKRIEPPSRRVQIDVRLDAIVLRALEQTPELRWQTAADLRTQVETLVAAGDADGRAAPRGQAPQTAFGPGELAGMRWKSVLWGAALVAAALAMPYFPLKVWAVDLAVLSTTLALLARTSRRLLLGAKLLVLVNGVAVAAAGIRLAFLTLDRERSWRDFVAAVCLGGVGFCVINLARSLKACAAEGANPGAAWTRPRTIAVTAVSLFLGAGTTAALLEHQRSHFLYGTDWPLDSSGLGELPLTVALRPSLPGGTSAGITSTDSRIAGQRVSLRALLAFAYGPPDLRFHWSTDRVVLPADVPDGKFDFLLTLPDQPKAALRALIKAQLGLVARRERQETDALVLLVADPGAAALAPTSGPDSSDRHVGGGYEFTNQPIDLLSDFLEEALGRPVVNATDLTQRYSGRLTWRHAADSATNLRALQTALAQGLGLELVPRREPIEMLVVTKAP
jgi:uncharacterized protein (TIGR03435 family)